ncbi:HNH endonuclease signature motif containing protein [Microbacterium sp. ASV81]|uniref:DUF222 domain-containing protein n=1 Tax=Microbacterium capsulatum TaxID=3041921 RepID=A0ABU0XK37_9MICO|nr:DUF222 domain-containing protein [Microbacterium sp. ASV81]MDQ4215488.1 DUF222 domain-containing protein [Microbacterium sp. ASV81]
MASFDAITALIPTLAGRVGAGASASDVQVVIENLGDEEAVAVRREAGEVGRLIEQIQLISAGVIAQRSYRESGHSGLAQRLGHRSAVSLLQELGGVTKGDAARQVRVGEALVAAPVQGEPSEEVAVGQDETAAPWYTCLSVALREERLSSAQFDAIRRGLGDPPDGASEAWEHAALQLTDEAAGRTVEELLAQARTIRDLLDPHGAEERFLARFERRSFRTFLDHDGMRRASIAFDDEGGAFVESIFAAALRPRRGGPRFVDPDEKTLAMGLAEDPRTNEQLAYDLLLDVVRAGTLAEPEAVFGTRQAGLRLVRVDASDDVPGPVAFTEDGLTALPAAVAERRMCETGVVAVTVDGCGNPLDVGRESRLFTARQRVALAIRDGGCRWTGCDRPASYCEAHHIDEWHRDQGRTDIDRGILLCRFHHMELHHGGWTITRSARTPGCGPGDFVLHDSAVRVRVLRERLPLRYLWGDIDPPPRRFRPAA